ncbi:cation diffusion facilitator family transporter [Inquilinus limosus]|uniref:cation diffusion facilitator family transporter n=1 Tax=Inquilinus limosus TaxID=171674 RepID=UPI00068CD5D4|nr:cation diffusion facilitator family transporter [Inquilinus limosus]
MDRASKAALASVFVGALVLGLKFLAWWVTGSVALYSDALESIINVVAAGAAFIALRVSAQPADANHPYGHTKAEYFSAVFEGLLVVLAALSILREAYAGLLDPQPLDAPALGLAINAVASAINAVWGWTLLRWGRRYRAPALVADGKHVLTDVYTSGGVLVGVALVALTGWLILDPILAAIVALNILWSGYAMIRDSVGGLMDEAVPDETLARIREAIAANGGGALEAHDVRTRHAGRLTFIDFHLVVPGAMTVSEAHDICDRIEATLKRDIGADTIIGIHVEPEEKAKHVGVAIARHRGTGTWSGN